MMILLANETRSASWNDLVGETISTQWIKWLTKPIQSGSISLSAQGAEIAFMLNSIVSVIYQQYLHVVLPQEFKERRFSLALECSLKRGVKMSGHGFKRAFRVGIAGPVGSGKTALVDCLSRKLWPRYNLAVVTNDIYTREDAEFLVRQGTLPPERVRGVETGGCPHAAIREDASMNLEAIAELEERLPGLEVVFVESGGDNLAAAFSPELVDVFMYVIDVAGGDKIPRKGGPGITRSDLLVINKMDLAPSVGASLEVMERDARLQRGSRPFIFTNLKEGVGTDEIITWLELQLKTHPQQPPSALGTYDPGDHDHHSHHIHLSSGLQS